MEKQIDDFLVLLGDGYEECEGYKFFRIVKRIPFNKNVQLELKAVDVNVVKNSGLAFWNIVLGKPMVSGGLDLDKIRRITINGDLLCTFKNSRPAVSLGLPERFDKLPEAIQSWKFLGNTLKISYQLRAKKESLDEWLQNMNVSDQERMDRLSNASAEFDRILNEHADRVFNRNNKDFDNKNKQIIDVPGSNAIQN